MTLSSSFIHVLSIQTSAEGPLSEIMLSGVTIIMIIKLIEHIRKTMEKSYAETGKTLSILIRVRY